MTRDHGGNIDSAVARFGGTDWIDLSTGINRVPYPVPDLPPEAFTALPTVSAMAALLPAAREATVREAAECMARRKTARESIKGKVS